MLTCQFRKGWQFCFDLGGCLGHILLQGDGTNLLSTLRGPWTIQHDSDGSVNTLWDKSHREFHILPALNSIEVKVLVSYDRTVSVIHHEIGVVLQVIGFLKLVISTIADSNIRTVERVVRPFMNGNFGPVYQQQIPAE